MIKTKRAYEPADSSDGYRVLVDRIWPRGLSRDRAQLDAWERDVAPSTELRRWYGHDPEKWPEFERRFRAELEASSAQAVLDRLAEMSRDRDVTLVYAARASEISNAEVIRMVLGERLSR